MSGANPNHANNSGLSSKEPGTGTRKEEISGVKITGKPEATAIEDRTILEQMGGLAGLVSSTLPVVVLIPVNSRWGMEPALISAVLVALAIMLWRLVRKENLQPAVTGLIGVVICAVIAWFSGDAKGFFLYGIWASFVLFLLSLLSIFLRWPAVGVVWKGINGEPMVWRKVPQALWSYIIATAGWSLVFLARFSVQLYVYNTGDSVTSLGLIRIIMGWPLTGLVTILTVLMVKRANKAVEDALEAGIITLPVEKENRS